MTKSTEIEFNKWYSFKERLPESLCGEDYIILATNNFHEIFSVFYNENGLLFYYPDCSQVIENENENFNLQYWCYIKKAPINIVKFGL